MSVYQHKESPFYHFDFQFKGERFHGSTGCTNKREAEAFERAERERAKQQAKVTTSAVSAKLDDVAGKYWSGVGQHHVGADTTWRDIERVINFFGPTMMMTEIRDVDVARLVAWRRGHRVTRHGRGLENAATAPFVARSTVNRSTTEVLKKLFTYARKTLHIPFEREPDWKIHWLKEPEERVRELHSDEADRLDEATRDDYKPIMEFAAASGLRLKECELKWSEVFWDTDLIVKPGKGGRTETVSITDTIREILLPLQGHHDTMVFTYVAARTRKNEGLIKGQRYPITYNGLKSAWKRLRAKAKVTSFRFHDFRHDLGTKVLRVTGNMKIAQKVLNHRDIKTTMKYAHVLQEEVAAAANIVQKSRRKSRSPTGEPSQVAEKQANDAS
jgi:integrase